MEAKVRWYLKDIAYALKKHQRIEIESRVKECNSAINALKRRQQSRSFDDTRSYIQPDIIKRPCLNKWP